MSSPGVGRAHVVHLYEEEESLLGTAGIYLGGSLVGGDRVVVVAAKPRWEAFQGTLRAGRIDVEAARDRGQILFADAGEALERVLVNGAPDRRRFHSWAEDLLKDGPRIRAYCEMEDILAGKGDFEAVRILESWWDDLLSRRFFPLFCAYGTKSFGGKEAAGDLRLVCAAHTEVICG